MNDQAPYDTAMLQRAIDAVRILAERNEPLRMRVRDAVAELIVVNMDRNLPGQFRERVAQIIDLSSSSTEDEQILTNIAREIVDVAFEAHQLCLESPIIHFANPSTN